MTIRDGDDHILGSDTRSSGIKERQRLSRDGDKGAIFGDHKSVFGSVWVVDVGRQIECPRSTVRARLIGNSADGRGIVGGGDACGV